MGVAVTQVEFRETLSEFCQAAHAVGPFWDKSGAPRDRHESIGDGDPGLRAKEKLEAHALLRA